MAAVTLEIDDELLARANAGAEQQGTDLKTSLLVEVRRLATKAGTREDRRAALDKLFEMADEFPTYLAGGMPSREERNAR